MSAEVLLSALAIALASLWTPGPNNAMLASSGATFGVRATVPHALGVSVGFAFMMLVVGLVLGGLFTQSALLREALRWGGAGLLLWVAWKIATAGGVTGADGRARPLRFHEAAAFQWINPKAWVMALGMTAQFVTPVAPVASASALAVLFVLAGLGSSFGWAGAGALMGRLLRTPSRLRAFNRTMGGLIALSVLWMLRS
jgi:threonine/homoserine/homoserine lactone efflux protein